MSFRPAPPLETPRAGRCASTGWPDSSRARTRGSHASRPTQPRLRRRSALKRARRQATRTIDCPGSGSRHDKDETERMTEHSTGTREQWLTARRDLLEAEKDLTRRSDELAQQRQQLPWVRIEKAYRFETDDGSVSLADLFRGRSQLLMYHFMFGPDYTAGCPVCSTIADGFNGSVAHLENHDVTMMAVSRAPIAAIQAYKRRMGWNFPWASSFGSDFNFDFSVSFTEEQQRQGVVDYNFRSMD